MRKRQLVQTFRTLYEDLLQAITSDNYEALEALCEETLLLELAAKIYEYEKYKGVQFRIVEGPSEICEVEVINHFYIKNASVKRAKNPTLKEHKLIQRRRNVLELVPKTLDDESAANSDHLDLSVLESLEAVKKQY